MELRFQEIVLLLLLLLINSIFKEQFHFHGNERGEIRKSLAMVDGERGKTTHGNSQDPSDPTQSSFKWDFSVSHFDPHSRLIAAIKNKVPVVRYQNFLLKMLGDQIQEKFYKILDCDVHNLLRRLGSNTGSRRSLPVQSSLPQKLFRRRTSSGMVGINQRQRKPILLE
ncbi:hypothetical protein M9H77_17105 [Catharanthus roseus]|uniref:Uncharacterized protein n=1 Tax=Catharanthus roseus TaxID=4058 RepID=A0ACC0B3U3_CATRO|nr:hypothetical protein M9H77_17105 [Catharanthus roseus]